MKHQIIGMVVMVLAAPALIAQVVVNEPFSHPDGNLVGQTPVTGGTWAAHSGGGNKAIQVASGQISLDQSSGSGEDVNTGFTAIGAGETLFASFDLTLPSGQTVNPDANGNYFAHFMTGTSFRGRVFVVAPSGGGDFGIALDANGSTPSVTWATDLSFDTTYNIVVSYDYNTGDSQLWVDPVNMMSTSISDTGGTASTAIDGFAFRQSNDYTGTQVIDNLLVGKSFSDVPVELMAFQVD